MVKTKGPDHPEAYSDAAMTQCDMLTPGLTTAADGFGSEKRHLSLAKALEKDRAAPIDRHVDNPPSLSSCISRGARIGVVEEGVLADLLVVDGDPLTNIKLLEDPTKNHVVIMKDG